MLTVSRTANFLVCASFCLPHRPLLWAIIHAAACIHLHCALDHFHPSALPPNAQQIYCISSDFSSSTGVKQSKWKITVFNISSERMNQRNIAVADHCIRHSQRRTTWEVSVIRQISTPYKSTSYSDRASLPISRHSSGGHLHGRSVTLSPRFCNATPIRPAPSTFRCNRARTVHSGIDPAPITLTRPWSYRPTRRRMKPVDVTEQSGRQSTTPRTIRLDFHINERRRTCSSTPELSGLLTTPSLTLRYHYQYKIYSNK